MPLRWPTSPLSSSLSSSTPSWVKRNNFFIDGQYLLNGFSLPLCLLLGLYYISSVSVFLGLGPQSPRGSFSIRQMCALSALNCSGQRFCHLLSGAAVSL